MTGEKKKKKRLNRSVLLAKKTVIRDGAGVSDGWAGASASSSSHHPRVGLARQAAVGLPSLGWEIPGDDGGGERGGASA